MDIKHRRFKTIEDVDGIGVMVEVPKYKTKGMLWWKKEYYDEADLQWAVVSTKGNLLYHGKGQPAIFSNITGAREFIKRIQAPKKETIIGPVERNGKQVNLETHDN